jgi:hypothetical protein
MTDDPTTLLKKLDFNPPCLTWTRPDPRGKEYGIWHARPAYGHNGVYMTAMYRPTETALPMFAINFDTPTDFERWAKHTL